MADADKKKRLRHAAIILCTFVFVVTGSLAVYSFMSICVVPEDPPFTGLTEEHQRRIWDAEHTTFALETHFGKPFVAALKTGAADELAAFFSDDFEGSLIDSEASETRGQSIVAENLFGASGHASSRKQWVRSLLQSLESVEKMDRARLRVLHIQEIEDDTWRCELLLTASGKDEGGQLVRWSARGKGDFRLADKAEAGTAPIASRWSFESVRVATSPRPLMEEVTDASNLQAVEIPDNWDLPVAQATAYRFQFSVEDFDRDGWLDIAVATKREPPILLRGRPDVTFEEVGEPFGISSEMAADDVYLAAWIDFDNDGFSDLLLGDRLYHNESGKSFRDVTSECGLEFGASPKGCTVADFDCDGRLDLYIIYDQPNLDVDASPGGESAAWVGDGRSGGDNQLWKNLGDGRFRRETYQSGADGGPRRSHAAAWLHFDDDRFPDLYIVNDFGPNRLLRNRGNGSFEDVTEPTGAGDFATSMGVAAGDLSGDGQAELYVANMYSKMGRRIIDYVSNDDYPPGVYEQICGSCAGNRVYQFDPSQSKFHESSEELEVNGVGWSYGPALADFDGDGLLDIYATTGYLSFARNEPDG